MFIKICINSLNKFLVDSKVRVEVSKIVELSLTETDIIKLKAMFLLKTDSLSSSLEAAKFLRRFC